MDETDNGTLPVLSTMLGSVGSSALLCPEMALLCSPKIFESQARFAFNIKPYKFVLFLTPLAFN